MKHVEEFLTEARNFRDFKKYNEFLELKFKAKECSIFSENNIITLSLKYSRILRNQNLFRTFIDFDVKVFPSGGIHPNSMIFEVYNVPRSFFDEIDIEMNAKKYNI